MPRVAAGIRGQFPVALPVSGCGATQHSASPPACDRLKTRLGIIKDDF